MVNRDTKQHVVVEKKWWKSLSVRGLVVVVLGAVLARFELELGDREMVVVAEQLLELVGMVMVVGGIGRRKDIVLGLMLGLSLGLGGCANTTDARVGVEGVTTQTQVSNSAYYADEVWSANFQGVTPTHGQIDAEGVNVQTGGLGTAMGAAGLVQLWSPKDVELEQVEIQTDAQGNVSFKASKVRTVISSVVGMYTAQVKLVTEATSQMTKEEAERYVQSLEQVGKISSDVASLLRDIYIPGLPSAPSP